ncbi:MAG: helix-turn-helix transcriptional regulator [Pseudomonadales bacterium]|nr:helix-turn-helix transcriptional regulator [Pseudomonadales bacterium]
MKWQELDAQPCSVARTLSVIGDRWTLLIIRNAFLRTRRFDDFHAQLGITKHVLSSRLKKLVEAGVFEKRAYQEKPARYEYRLTEKGLDLYPIILGLVGWGDKWMDEGKGPPVEYFHKTCNHKTQPTLVCSECHEPLDPREMMAMPGPGLKDVNS